MVGGETGKANVWVEDEGHDEDLTVLRLPALRQRNMHGITDGLVKEGVVEVVP